MAEELLLLMVTICLYLGCCVFVFFLVSIYNVVLRRFFCEQKF